MAFCHSKMHVSLKCLRFAPTLSNCRRQAHLECFVCKDVWVNVVVSSSTSIWRGWEGVYISYVIKEWTSHFLCSFENSDKIWSQHVRDVNKIKTKCEALGEAPFSWALVYVPFVWVPFKKQRCWWSFRLSYVRGSNSSCKLSKSGQLHHQDVYTNTNTNNSQIPLPLCIGNRIAHFRRATFFRTTL